MQSGLQMVTEIWPSSGEILLIRQSTDYALNPGAMHLCGGLVILLVKDGRGAALGKSELSLVELRVVPYLGARVCLKKGWKRA